MANTYLSVLVLALFSFTTASQEPVLDHARPRRALHWDLEDSLTRQGYYPLGPQHYSDTYTMYDHGLYGEHVPMRSGHKRFWREKPSDSYYD